MKGVEETIKDRRQIDRIVAKYRGRPGELLCVLEDIQKMSEYNYLSRPVLKYIAGLTGLPFSRIYSVVTFYSFFNLIPQGENCITICRGTACHTKGSKEILDYLKGFLGFDEQELEESEKKVFTTEDRKFTLRTVACFGQCALAPVVEVNGIIHGYMTIEKVKNILSGICKKKGCKR